jgi:DNA-directed RNA polymerase subunit RPC12/RpoP
MNEIECPNCGAWIEYYDDLGPDDIILCEHCGELIVLYNERG